jgi:hypothetical protein
MSMKSLIILAAAAALAVTATPALAKSKKKHPVHHGYYAEQYAPQYAPYGGWTTRNVSDPSFGNRGAINYARSLGRCVEDLGYGRYKYCGW